MKTLLTVAALTVATLVNAPLAKATPDQDQQLFDTLNRAGIALNDRAVPAAYGVCSEVWRGVHPEYVAAEVASANADWYFEQAEVFVAAAIMIYCPPAAHTARKVAT